MTITICIGSSCHLKGSRSVIAGIQSEVEAHGLSDQIELSGSFCSGQCEKGVCVKIDEELFTVSPETVKTFFENEVLKRVS